MAETRDKVKEGIDAAAQGAKRMTDRAADTFHGAQHSAQTAAGGVMDSAKQNLGARLAFAADAVHTDDPLGVDLGSLASRRILRCSPLTPVAPAC